MARQGMGLSAGQVAAAAKRRTVAKRGEQLLPQGANTRVNLPADPSRGSVSPAQSTNERMSQPDASTPKVEVAPPPIPSLSPSDEAQRTLDLNQQDTYLNGLGQQLTQMTTDIGLKLGDIERSLAQGLEANDWNTAAR